MSYKALELSQIEKADAKELLIHNDKCDKYDYLIAVGCGVIGGTIDMFLLRTPGQSVLENLRLVAKRRKCKQCCQCNRLFGKEI